LINWRQGDQHAGEKLMSVAYDQLRRLAAHYFRQEPRGHTLQATALVHELYLRLFSGEPVNWQNRAHFFAVASQQLRRILVDHARAVQAAKRGSHRVKVSLTEIEGIAAKREQDLLELNEALERLELLDARAAKVVELRFFAGMKETEIAEVLEISLATVNRDWKVARAWLNSQLMSNDNHGESLPRMKLS
jgi:RNA polymerase sigma factor (TIGR02999 family)